MLHAQIRQGFLLSSTIIADASTMFFYVLKEKNEPSVERGIATMLIKLAQTNRPASTINSRSKRCGTMWHIQAPFIALPRCHRVRNPNRHVTVSMTCSFFSWKNARISASAVARTMKQSWPMVVVMIMMMLRAPPSFLCSQNELTGFQLSSALVAPQSTSTGRIEYQQTTGGFHSHDGTVKLF